MEPLKEAQAAELAALELSHQRVIGGEQGRLRLDTSPVQVEVVGHHHQRDLVLLVVLEHGLEHRQEILQLALERLIRDIVGARRAEQGVQLDEQLRALNDGCRVAVGVGSHGPVTH